MAITVRELVTKWGFDVDEKPLKRMEGNIKNLKRLATGVTIAITGISVATTILLKQAGQFEQWEIALSTMLGSADKAAELLEEIKKFTLETPFQLPQVIEGARRLLAFGIEAEKLIPTLKMLGDVSAGLGTPLGRMILNFGQVKTQAKLTGRELRDFAILGVPLIAALSKVLKVAEKDVAGLIQRGAVDFAAVEQAFKDMSGAGGKFSNLMLRQMQALFGIISNVKDVLIQIAIVLGQQMLPQAKRVLKQLFTFLLVNKKLIELKVGRIIKQLLNFTKQVLKVSLRFVRVLRTFIDVLGGLEKTLKGIGIAIGVIFAFNILSFLGNLLLVISSLISSITLVGNTALIAQAKAVLLPLALGAAFVGLILLFEDLVSFFKGRDSITRLFSDAFSEMSVQARILVGALNPVLSIFTVIKDTLELMKALGITGIRREDIIQKPFLGRIPFMGTVEAQGALGRGTVEFSPRVPVTINVGPGVDTGEIADATETGVARALGSIEDLLVDLVNQTEDRGK